MKKGEEPRGYLEADKVQSLPVDLMVIHLSCSSCLVSVSLASPACRTGLGVREAP